jgi:MFS family permease
LPALLVRPIRAQFAFSDTEFSLLQGCAFSICYTLMGLPLGRMVDCATRRNLIYWGMVFWTAMTAASAFASSYTMLFIARMGVGEVVLAPAAYSMIADYVAPERRGRALALYYTPLGVGSGASMLLGGWLLGAIPKEGVELPLLGLLPAWRICFLAAAAFGVGPRAITADLTRAHAPRSERKGGGKLGRRIHRFPEAAPPDLCALNDYLALLAMIGDAMLSWAPALFEQCCDVPISRAGTILGLIIAGAGLSGTLFSGFLSGRWLRMNVDAACFLLIAGLLGLGLGPTLVALVSDHVLHGGSKVHDAIGVMVVTTALVAIWLCWSGLKPFAVTRMMIRTGR